MTKPSDPIPKARKKSSKAKTTHNNKKKRGLNTKVVAMFMHD